MKPTIEAFTMSHYDAVVSLWQSIPGIWLDLDDADSRSGMRLYLRRNPGMSFIAKNGASVVGAVLCGHDGRRGYLHHLAVLPSCRRQGIGSKLVERCLQALAARGIKRCNIFVFDDNASGIRFWSKTRWKRYDGLSVLYKGLGEVCLPPRKRHKGTRT